MPVWFALLWHLVVVAAVDELLLFLWLIVSSAHPVCDSNDELEKVERDSDNAGECNEEQHELNGIWQLHW